MSISLPRIHFIEIRINNAFDNVVSKMAAMFTVPQMLTANETAQKISPCFSTYIN